MSRLTLADEMVESYFDGSLGKFQTIDNLVESMVDRIQEQELNAYQLFFKSKLEEFGVKSPNELDEDGKKRFFASIKKEWKKKK